MEVANGVHEVDGVVGSNVILLTGERMAVVDTGFSGNGEAILSYIKKIGRSADELEWIVLTHFHHDHSGSALELHNLTGAHIVAHKAEAHNNTEGKLVLRKGDEGQVAPIWYMLGQRFARIFEARMNSIAQNITDTPVHQTVEDGDIIPCSSGLRIIHTPGHTPGSICPILTSPKLLFLGDSVINNINRLSRPLMWDRNKRRQLDTSLRSLRNLDAEFASFGHGPLLSQHVMDSIRLLTDRPYDLPTWRIALKNWSTLRKFRNKLNRTE